ncbi:MAG TPA: thioredoxin domain-containing protein, partial [Polyangia bacterium]|nr:thioredoxin domain-containing protein [Polyangia bacterium]
AFRKALDTRAAKPLVDADLALGRRLGVEGTPNFFIDGRPVTGAQPFEAFKEVIDDELGRAGDLLARGVARDKLYATLLAGAKPSLPAEAPAPGRAPGAETTVYRVPVLDAPARGGAQPKVTIVEFSDFQCPFCQRAEETMQALLKAYGPDLAVVYRHNPLPFHTHAMKAAQAAEAARQQGKFWEMHDTLFAHQQALDDKAVLGYAQAIGLDVGRFAAALDDAETRARITRDMDDARKLGAHGTPTFFIDGRPLRGAQPVEAFKRAIYEELKKADALLAAGTPRAGLYAALTKDGRDKADLPAPEVDPGDDLRVRVDVAGAPARGPADAPVTIVEFADFQCPFCQRAEETLERLRHDHPNDVRFVWRDLPLPFHAEARPAALAARAAAAQGMFWAMHDRRYAAAPGTLGPELYERTAAELGLDVARFRAALDAEKAKRALDADGLAAAKAGATGTPTFFINGKRLAGAQPLEVFEARLAAELKIADQMIAKGTPRGKVYAALMKEALPVRPPAKHDDDGDDRGPEADTTVYPVKPGDAPSKGRADAPLVLVVFSDFQCPFCQRAEETLERLR